MASNFHRQGGVHRPASTVITRCAPGFVVATEHTATPTRIRRQIRKFADEYATQDQAVWNGHSVAFTPGSKYSSGLNDDYAATLGDIAASFTHLEEGMIRFFMLLLGREPMMAGTSPARQIFRSIIAPNVRIKMLRAVLEKSEINREKIAEYDAVITEYEFLNGKRNIYVYGLWATHDESGRAFLSEPSPDEFYFFQQRYVTHPNQ